MMGLVVLEGDCGITVVPEHSVVDTAEEDSLFLSVLVPLVPVSVLSEEFFSSIARCSAHFGSIRLRALVNQ